MHHLRARLHLANGKHRASPRVVAAPTNGLVRLRAINSAAVTSYRLYFPTRNVRVVAVDGQWVQPASLIDGGFWLAVGQRADFLMRLPVGDADAPPLFPVVALPEGHELDDYAGIVFAEPGVTPDALEAMNSVVAAATAVPPPGPVSDGIVNQEIALQALFPFAQRGIDRTFEINITGLDGFSGINGRSYLLPPMVPSYEPNPAPLLVRRGERVCVRFRNQNADPHPFHVCVLCGLCVPL